MSDLTYIKQKAEEIGVKISDEQAGQLETYYQKRK